MDNYFISSCNLDGKLYQFCFDQIKIKNINTIDTGNIRGLTQVKNKILYVKNDILFETNIKGDKYKMFKLPCNGHDIKFEKSNKNLLFAGTQNNTLYRLSLNGEVLREIRFDVKYWFNCVCVIPEGRVLVCLSCKRPNNESKIIILDNDFNIKTEYICPEKDEIHSPFYFKNKAYWCRSNTNRVNKSDLNFKKIEEVIFNDSGYTRGLYITNDLIILGTSENRHSENSTCISEINCGCIHLYKSKQTIYKEKVESLEIYDVLKYKHAKL
jgi:hypothetical protein